MPRRKIKIIAFSFSRQFPIETFSYRSTVSCAIGLCSIKMQQTVVIIKRKQIKMAGIHVVIPMCVNPITSSFSLFSVLKSENIAHIDQQFRKPFMI